MHPKRIIFYYCHMLISLFLCLISQLPFCVCVVCQPQLNLCEFKNSISRVTLYFCIDSHHLLMSKGLGRGGSPHPCSLPKEGNSLEVLSRQHILLLCCQIGVSISSVPQASFTKGTSYMENSPPLHNFSHLISDSDWGCQHYGGHLTEGSMWVADWSNTLCILTFSLKS